MNIIEKKHLAGLLMSCPGMLHVTVLHNLRLYASVELHKNNYYRKGIARLFGKM